MLSTVRAAHVFEDRNVMSDFHTEVHLLVCESQEAVQAGVSCCCQSVSVPLQPDGLQPHTHRPLWHTHLRYDRHAHLWTHPWLQYSACGSVKTQRRWEQAGWWWQSTKIGVWNHNWRSRVRVSLIIWVKPCTVGVAVSTVWMHSVWLYYACLPMHLSVIWKHLCLHLYVAYVPVPSCAAQSPRVTDEFIQHVEYLAEGGSLCSLPLPAIQH